WPYRDGEIARIAAAFDDALPGSADLGAIEYLERLLTAFDHEPPRIWAAPPGIDGGWLDLGPWERDAWSRRIDDLRDVVDRIAADEATAADRRTIYTHACCATYGDPAYSGNRDGGGWAGIGFPEPMFPPARTPAKSSNPEGSPR
ncbi:MAG: hypothetical protein ACR2MB_04535, partial [Acidimicrobiales bacterium]